MSSNATPCVYAGNTFPPRLTVLTFSPRPWRPLISQSGFRVTTHDQVFIKHASLFIREDYRWEMLFPVAWTIPPVVYGSFERLHWCCLSIAVSWNLSFHIAQTLPYLAFKSQCPIYISSKSKMLKHVLVVSFCYLFLCTVGRTAFIEKLQPRQCGTL